MAADSEMKTEEKPGEIPAKPSEEIIVRGNVTVKIMRGEGGKFKRQPKAMPSSKEFTRLTRNYMLSMEVGKDGKISKGSKSKYEQMCENIICIARRIPTVLPNGDTIKRDAKEDMAAVQAYKVITDRGLGQLPKSEEEIEAMQTQGVKMVIVLPPEMVNKEVIEEKPREKLVPSFIEGEFVENK